MLSWLVLAMHALLDSITVYGTQNFWPLAAIGAGDGAAAVLIRNITAVERQDQDEISIQSCKLCGKPAFVPGFMQLSA